MNIMITDSVKREVQINLKETVSFIKSQAFVAFYDGADIRADNTIAPIDWAVPVLLQAPVRRYEAFEDIFENNSAIWNKCNACLKALGYDRPLATDKDTRSKHLVEDCFSAFMSARWIGPSIAAKILHKKRPLLIPVVDNYVATILKGPSRQPRTAKVIADIIFGPFQETLIKNIEPLGEVQKAVKEATPSISISLARILDIVIWRYADSNKKSYGLER
jgi:hypothetical protein